MAACGGSGNKSTQGGGGASSGAPVHGGNLNVELVGVSWGSLGVATPFTGLGTWPAQSPIYDTLLKLAPSGKVLPDLATSYSYSNNGNTLTLQLRKNVQFQDHTPFNAQAVVFNLDRQLDPANHSLCAPNLTAVKSVSASGSDTVVIQTKTPDRALPAVFAQTGCGFIASPTAVKKYGKQFGNHPVGTGPFKFVSEVNGSTLKVEKWSGYWQKGKPYLNSITFHLLNDGTTAYQSIQSGTAQVLPYNGPVGPTVLKQANADSSVKVVTSPATAFDYIRFEVGKGPFKSVLAREAVDAATNQQALSKSLDYGLYKPIKSPIAKSSWAYTSSVTSGYSSYNLAKAKKLVQQLGGLKFTLSFNNTTAFLELAQALKAQWGRAGINASLDPVDFTTLLGQIHSGNYQGLMNSWGMAGDPDPNLYFQFRSGQISSDSFNNPGMNKYLDQARSAPTRADRKAAYAKFSQAWNKYVPWDLLPAAPDDVITTKNVHGLTNRNQLISWTDAWLS